jgi:hypothetical protein
MEADILVVDDVPEHGWVTFRALHDRYGEVEFLRFLCTDCQEHRVIDERSFAVRVAGNCADYVYQTELLAGAVIAFPGGSTIGIGDGPMRAILSAIRRAKKA